MQITIPRLVAYNAAILIGKLFNIAMVQMYTDELKNRGTEIH